MACHWLMRVLGLFSLAMLWGCGEESARTGWGVHDMSRPQPPVVTPGVSDHAPPANAVVLFDGKGFEQWESSRGGGPVRWTLEGDAMQVAAGKGGIRTKKSFGDCQLHIEWSAPAQVRNEGQQRGNSGVFLMSKYEVQVLDSFNNTTYPDGQAGAVYGQYPPLFNVCRAPGQWQSYDIIFRRPIFRRDGGLERPARMTVLHNGVVIQDNVEIQGATAHKKEAAYQPHADKLPISLQDHNDPVRFRNIWVVELPEIQTYDIAN